MTDAELQHAMTLTRADMERILNTLRPPNAEIRNAIRKWMIQIQTWQTEIPSK